MTTSSLSNEEISSIPEHLWKALPYPAFRRASHIASHPEAQPPSKLQKSGAGKRRLEVDIDEWILEHEKQLVYTKHRPHDWRQGLVNLDDEEAVFPKSTLTRHGRVIPRPESLSGQLLLGALRHPHACIQPSSSAFKDRFGKLCGGLLDGLDWNNVLVAGGIVLGALYAVKSPLSSVKDDDLESSDVDLYIYGLDSNAATEKSISSMFIAKIYPVARGLSSFVTRRRSRSTQSTPSDAFRLYCGSLKRRRRFC
ncbi:hypothetical protein C8F01DRAFT_34051 [Mycena amicta]|nr:hypothetical protein C8F01DRAFT_34051 [Mycena amicta]